MLEGKIVNMRIVEKEDLSLIAEWFNSPEFVGKYSPFHRNLKQISKKIMKNLALKKRGFRYRKRMGTRSVIWEWVLLDRIGRLAMY